MATGNKAEDTKIEEITDKIEDLSVSKETALAVSAPSGTIKTQQEIDDFIASHSEYGKQVVQDLRALQDEHKKHVADFDRELSELRVKYEKLYAPIYQKRSERLQEGEEGAEKTGTPALTGFWLKCFQNSRVINETINTPDPPILEYLMNVEFEYIDTTEQELGFRLKYTFAKNPYFEPNVVVKTYNMCMPEEERQAILTSTHCTPINWYEGKNPTRTKIERKQRNKRTKQTRTITEDVDQDSFFTFFVSQELPSEKDLEIMEEDEVSQLEHVIETDYEMGITVRDKIIPNAIKWYLGEAVEEEDEDFDDDYDLDDEDDEDDDDDDNAYVQRRQPNKRK